MKINVVIHMYNGIIEDIWLFKEETTVLNLLDEKIGCSTKEDFTEWQFNRMDPSNEWLWFVSDLE